MENRIVDADITLIPYYPNPGVTLGWYQDPELCRQVDNTDRVYTPERLEQMYTFLSTHGDCWYIQFRGVLVGDVTLQNTGELSIVICREYQNRHIGRRCIADMLSLAREKGFREVKANIYSFNTQSQRMFRAAGFRRVADEWYTCTTDSAASAGELIACCGVDCAACPDDSSGACPSCRGTEWKADDICMPVKCCREKGIDACGFCDGFPCGDMREFYEESENHRQACQRMRRIKEA